MPSPRQTRVWTSPPCYWASGECLESSPHRDLQRFPQGRTGGAEQMNLCFREFPGAVQRDKSCTKTTLCAKGTQQFSIPKIPRGCLSVTNGTVQCWGCCWMQGDGMTFPSPFLPCLLSFHCSAPVSCGSVDREGSLSPEHPSLFPSSKVLPCTQGFSPLSV